ncbi:MAG: AraC family transcriptional regulator [Bacteroidota bacterium]
MKPILEPIHPAKQKTISAFVYAKPNFEMPWHFHPQHELTYIEESLGTKFIGDYVGSYEAGELVLLRSNLPHFWKNHVQEGQLSKSIVIQWNKGIFTHVPELQAVFDMLKVAAKGLIFERDAIQVLIPSLKQLPNRKGAALYVEFLSLLLQLSNCPYRTLSNASFSEDLPSKYSSRMSKIHHFTETSFTRKVYLKEVATLVNMSEPSFSRFFKKIMGRSYFSFLNEYRINRASRMLMDTDQTVAAIAYHCGYESLPFFHKQFAKYKSTSPLRYRKQHAVSGAIL